MNTLEFPCRVDANDRLLVFEGADPDRLMIVAHSTTDEGARAGVWLNRDDAARLRDWLNEYLDTPH